MEVQLKNSHLAIKRVTFSSYNLSAVVAARWFSGGLVSYGVLVA